MELNERQDEFTTKPVNNRHHPHDCKIRNVLLLQIIEDITGLYRRALPQHPPPACVHVCMYVHDMSSDLRAMYSVLYMFKTKTGLEERETERLIVRQVVWVGGTVNGVCGKVIIKIILATC